VLGASVSKDKYIMKYDYKYNWLFGDQPKINKEVVNWLFEKENYQGIGFKVDSVRDDFPRLVDAIEDEIDSARTEAALERLEYVDVVLLSNTIGELWFSFATNPSGSSARVFKNVLVVKVAKGKPGDDVPLSARINYARW
jgi:hypothetical protein